MEKKTKKKKETIVETKKVETEQVKEPDFYPEHIHTLLKHKHIYDLYVQTNEVVNLHPYIKKDIFDAYRVENPTYEYNKACHVCTVEMLEKVYKWLIETYPQYFD